MMHQRECCLLRNHWPLVRVSQKTSQLVNISRCRTSSKALATETSRDFIAEERIFERVLRYPDGQERRIRYPAHLIIEEEDSVTLTDSTDSLDRDEDWWGIESYYYGALSDDDEEPYSTSAARDPQELSRETEAAVLVQPKRPSPKDFPSSPAELLRFINSEQYKAAADEQLRLVKESFRIVEQSPWVQSKALYVLATAQKGNDNFMTYSLKTRVSQPEQEDELSRILGKRRADGSNLIRMEEIRDGVVAFEDESDAHRYSAMLEADGVQAVVAECDSHTLFRETASTQAVVVLISECQGLQCHLPLPEELKSALKAKPSLEDSSGL